MLSGIPTSNSLSILPGANQPSIDPIVSDSPASMQRQVSQSPFAMPMSTLDFAEVIEEESEEEPTPLESIPITPLSESPSNPRGISHFNPSQSILFMGGSSIDRLYSSSINISLM